MNCEYQRIRHPAPRYLACPARLCVCARAATETRHLPKRVRTQLRRPQRSMQERRYLIMLVKMVIYRFGATTVYFRPRRVRWRALEAEAGSRNRRFSRSLPPGADFLQSGQHFAAVRVAVFGTADKPLMGQMLGQKAPLAGASRQKAAGAPARNPAQMLSSARFP